MVCYAAIWLGGKTWAYLWRERPERGLVPASRYDGLGAGGGSGEIPVYVMNCASSSTVEADAYDSRDSVEGVAASSKSVSTGESASLHCAGDGKGYCKMAMWFKGSPAQCYGSSPSSTELTLDWGRWAVVTGFEVAASCHPIIEQLSSQPASCEAVGR
jgi:hypothetical protein